MPENSIMASNLQVQTAGKLEIGMDNLVDAKKYPISPSKRANKIQFGAKKQRSESVSHQQTKFYGKRRHSFGTDGKHNGPPFKRRNKGTIVPPTKFLLGGNINDPLNLGSLADEEINRSLNEATPYSSPVPTPQHRKQVEVYIPPNINDPLNLNAGDDADLELNLISPKSKRRKHRKRKKHISGEVETNVIDKSTEDLDSSKEDSTKQEAEVAERTTSPTPKQDDISRPPPAKIAKRPDDKIVSPVVRQPGKRKRSNTYSRSVSKEDQEKDAEKESKTYRKLMERKGTEPKLINFRKKDEVFQYGNYNRYYGYRNPNLLEDPRLRCFKREWFVGKDVLDIGCNVGFLTLSLAKDFKPKKIIGLDIDGKLIKAARKNVRHYLTDEVIQDCSEFPISLTICHGPIATAASLDTQQTPRFPNNVFFVQGNYILESDDLLETQRPEFDVILCLSLTKWVHINWGDKGLKQMFKRIFAQLRPGGRLILEAQAWPSYGKKKKLTEKIYRNYQQIEFRPEQFTEYLLSREVGFSTCEVIDTPFNPSKGFRRTMQLFTKGCSTPLRDQNVSAKSSATVTKELPLTEKDNSSSK